MYPLISGYHIESELGQGGMAMVYLATEEQFQRLVAIKVMDLKLAGNPHFTKRFLREGHIVAKLSHPNIIKVFNTGIADNRHYLMRIKRFALRLIGTWQRQGDRKHEPATRWRNGLSRPAESQSCPQAS